MRAEGNGGAANLRRRMERGLASYTVDLKRWSAATPEPARLLLPLPAVIAPPEGLSREELVRHLVADPAYQLQ